MKRRLIRALVVCLVLGAGACQRGDDLNGVATADGARSAGPSGTATPAGDPAELARQFTRCMKDQGVEVQVSTADGGGSDVRIGSENSKDGAGSGTDPQKVQAAIDKCEQFMPGGGEPPKPDPAQLEAQRQASKCMRDNGVPNFPDPDSDGRIKIESGPNNGMDPRSDAFKAAQQKCMQRGLGGKGVGR